MKINPTNHAHIIKKYEKMNKTESQDKINVNQKDKVEISKDYEVYEKAVKKLRESKDFDNTHKLDMLKQQIAKGEYKVNSKELAQNIINRLKTNQDK